MRFDTEAEVDLGVDDIISEMSDDEKKEMYDALSDEFAHSAFDESFDVARYLGNCKPFELKKLLCNALNVPSYYDEQALRNALEKIIKA